MNPDRRESRLHRMPYGFGPTPGPRQDPTGRPFAWENVHRLTIATSFLTEGAQLEALLPPGFALAGEPVVSVEMHVLSRLEWLAGRGYSMLQVRFPARYAGRVDEAIGSFLCVLWENLADPVISGREDLGFAKLWCELPPPRVLGGRHVCTAAWQSHQFAEMSIDGLTEAPALAPPAPGLEHSRNDGTLHYKYMPATQDWGAADVAHACLSPSGGSARIERVQLGSGSVRFLPTSWEQMPTQFHIVSALAALPQIESRGGRLIEARGGTDYSDQRRLG